jgi:DNA-binding GntR family transcriptional regulator
MNRTPSSTGSQMRLQRKSMAGEVADELRRRILSGEIDEGTQLMQEQLAAEFGISKVPIREALFQLEAEGFVTQQFHRGAVVSGLSPAEIMEIFELRVQIEMWLLELGMAAATDEDIADARSLADQFEASDDPVVAWELNWRFHEALYRPAGKPFAVEHLKKLHFQTARYVQTQYGVAIDKHKITAEHLELLDRYQQKSQKTKTFLRNHIIVAAKKLTEHLSKLQKKA